MIYVRTPVWCFSKTAEGGLHLLFWCYTKTKWIENRPCACCHCAQDVCDTCKRPFTEKV
jgi:hypothetical protein